jgi:hypothetical protein
MKWIEVSLPGSSDSQAHSKLHLPIFYIDFDRLIIGRIHR